MTEFLQIAFSLPTVIFSVLLVVSFCYWLVVIMGFLDIDLFDIDVDVDIDGVLDAGLDGAAEGAFDSATEGALEAAAEGGTSFLTSILSLLSVGRVPITILASFVTLFGWVLSFSGYNALTNILDVSVGPLLATGLFFGAFFLATALAGIAVRPLRGAFETVTRRGAETLIGEVCIITTGSVTETFGQATLADGGAGLNLTVRADRNDSGLKRGDRVLIIGFDAATSTYQVEPYDVVLGFDNDLERSLQNSTADELQLETQQSETTASGDRL